MSSLLFFNFSIVSRYILHVHDKTKNGILHFTRLRLVIAYLRLTFMLSHSFKMPTQFKNVSQACMLGLYNLAARR